MSRAPSPKCVAAIATALALFAATANAETGGIRVRILDSEGQAVPQVVVSARFLDAGKPVVTEAKIATMNQRDLAFQPHILVVESGTKIRFPNEDDVRHHVYSFSKSKKFDMTIASGQVNGPLTFDKAGVVTLGCNIHDDMLAYIVIVDTPHFTKTDANGSAELDTLESGRYELSIWTPRVAAKHLPDPVTVEIEPGTIFEYEHRFRAKLYPPYEDPEDSSLEWSDY
jgi:plastocyanin